MFMVEYCFDMIRASAGQDFMIGARITDINQQPITEGCVFVLHDESEEMLAAIEGSFNGDFWIFTVPAGITAGREGRHWYCIRWHDMSLCFNAPIYLK